MDRFGFGSDGRLHHGHLGGVRIHPFQARAAGDLLQVAQGQAVGLDFGHADGRGCSRRRRGCSQGNCRFGRGHLHWGNGRSGLRCSRRARCFGSGRCGGVGAVKVRALGALLLRVGRDIVDLSGLGGSWSHCSGFGFVAAGFGIALTAVAAITVTAAAFAALAAVAAGLLGGCGVDVVGRGGFCSGGLGTHAGVSGNRAVHWRAVAAFTAAFTVAFATFAAAFATLTAATLTTFRALGARCAFAVVLLAHGVFGAAGFGALFLTAFARLALGAVTSLCALTTRGAFGLFATGLAALAAAVATFLTFVALTTLATAFTATATTAVAVTATAIAAFAGLLFFFGWGGFGRSGFAAAKQALEPAKETTRRSRGGCGRSFGSSRCWGLRFGGGHWGWCVRQDAFDDRGLLVGGLLRTARHRGRVLDLFGHGVAGFDAVQTRVVVLEALDLVVRRFQRTVGYQQHVQALLEFDFGDLGALFVEQEGGHLDRHLRVHGGGVVLHGLFLNDAQDLQRRAFGVADVAGATAARAGNRGAFAQGGLEALAAHLEQAELADRAELHAGAVLAQRVAQAVFDFAAVLALLHVDEVDHDQAAEVAQAHLAGHLVGGFQVGAGCSFLDVTALDGACRVHVHRDQGFGVVDHDRTARGQLHGAGVGRLDLVLDLEAAEQGRIVAVAFDAGGVLGHHVAHELLSLLVDVVGVDQDVADVVVEVVADGADHQARFLVDQERAFAGLGGAVDGVPEFEQVVQVPLQFGGAATDAGGARDDGHALGVFELVHRLLEFGAVIALDAAAHATAARVVGHQHHIAAGQGHEGGQGRALVATLFLFDLDQQLLAFLDHVLDAGLAGRDAFGKVLARDFLERQEAVAVLAVVDETGFERGLDAGDDGLVDVAFALFAPFDFDFVVEEFLSVDDGQAAFFGLCGVDQHPLHDAFLLFLCRCGSLSNTRATSTDPQGVTDAGQNARNEGNCRGERDQPSAGSGSGFRARGWGEVRGVFRRVHCCRHPAVSRTGSQTATATACAGSKSHVSQVSRFANNTTISL